MGTAIPGVKAAFVAALEARPALETLIIGRGRPNPPLPLTGEELYILGVENGDARKMSDYPGGPVAETFDVRCVLDVLDKGTQDEAEDRAWEIIDELIIAVEDAPNLGQAATAFFAVTGEGSAGMAEPMTSRWAARVEGDLRVTARR